MSETTKLLRLPTVARDDYLDALWAKGRAFCAGGGHDESAALDLCKQHIGADLEACQMFMGGFEEAQDALLRAKIDLPTIEIQRVFQGAFNDAPTVDEFDGGGEHWLDASFTEDTFREIEKRLGNGAELTFGEYAGYHFLRISNALDAVDFGVCRICFFKPR